METSSTPSSNVFQPIHIVCVNKCVEDIGQPLLGQFAVNVIATWAKMD